jgi:hypothetical protein
MYIAGSPYLDFSTPCPRLICVGFISPARIISNIDCRVSTPGLVVEHFNSPTTIAYGDIVLHDGLLCIGCASTLGKVERVKNDAFAIRRRRASTWVRIFIAKAKIASNKDVGACSSVGGDRLINIKAARTSRTGLRGVVRYIADINYVVNAG